MARGKELLDAISSEWKFDYDIRKDEWTMTNSVDALALLSRFTEADLVDAEAIFKRRRWLYFAIAIPVVVIALGAFFGGGGAGGGGAIVIVGLLLLFFIGLRTGDLQQQEGLSKILQEMSRLSVEREHELDALRASYAKSRGAQGRAS